MKVCPECGAQYPDSYLLCKEDGFPLRDGAAEAAIPSPEKALVGEDETTAVLAVESMREDGSTDVAGPPSVIDEVPTNVVVNEDPTDLGLEEEPTNVVEDLPAEDLVEEEPSRPGSSRFRQDEDSLEPEKALPGASSTAADEGPTDIVDHDEPTKVEQGVIESVLAKMKQEAEEEQKAKADKDEVPIRSAPERLPPVRKPEVILSKPEPRPDKAKPVELEAKLEKLQVKPKLEAKTKFEAMPKPEDAEPRAKPEREARRGQAPPAAVHPLPAERGDAELDDQRPKTDFDATRPVPSISEDEVALLEEAEEPAPLPESSAARPRAASASDEPAERETPFGPASRLAAAASAAPQAMEPQLTAEVAYSYTPQPLARKHIVLWGGSMLGAILITAVVVWSVTRDDDAVRDNTALAAAALDANQHIATAADAAVVPDAAVAPDLELARDAAQVLDTSAAPDSAVVPPDASASPRVKTRRPRRSSRRRRRRRSRRARPRAVRRKPKPKKKGVFQRTVDPFAE
jgi:hypothetical protein